MGTVKTFSERTILANYIDMSGNREVRRLTPLNNNESVYTRTSYTFMKLFYFFHVVFKYHVNVFNNKTVTYETKKTLNTPA